MEAKWYSVLLLLSLLLNAFFLLRPSHHIDGHNYRKGRMLISEKEWGWSRKAGDEAEYVAEEYKCSGHGNVFVDTYLRDENGSFLCECNPCYNGPDCSHLLPDCVVDVQQGDPVFLEPFWRRNAEAGATVVAAWYRMSYDVSKGLEYAATSPELEKQIRALHEVVGNAVTKGRYIVLGTGSTQLINAAVYSLSHPHIRNPSKVVAAAPYYGAYRSQTEMFDSKEYVWKGNARSWIEKAYHLNSSEFIEFVASPNNPDGLVLSKGVLTSKNVRDIYDHAYYWPHLTAISRPADDDLMLFTLSKVTGHAGSRLGWAIVKDYEVYEKMYEYVEQNTLGVSHDTQLRASRLLKAVVDGYKEKNKSGNEKQLLFHYAYSVMRKRWQRLSQILSESDRFSLQHLEPRYCTFFKTLTGPSPAYAWVKCERKEESDCRGVLMNGGILGRNGTAFGANKRYVRLSLITRDDNFALLERRLKALVLS